MRPQYLGRIANAGFDGSSNFFYLALTRVEIPPRARVASFRSRLKNCTFVYVYLSTYCLLHIGTVGVLGLNLVLE